MQYKGNAYIFMTQSPNSHETAITVTAVGLALEYPSTYRPLRTDSRSRVIRLHAEAVVALWTREMGVSDAGAGLAMLSSVISGSKVSAHEGLLPHLVALEIVAALEAVVEVRGIVRAWLGGKLNCCKSN